MSRWDVMRWEMLFSEFSGVCGLVMSSFRGIYVILGCVHDILHDYV
jgi:hypothetical protein